MLGPYSPNFTPHPAVVVLSGGQDSTTCLYWAKQRYAQVHAITFNYGQLHSREINAARAIARFAGVASHEVLSVGNILKGTSPLTNKEERLAQYEDAYSLPGGLEKTFVPGRNLLFLTLAANHAMSILPGEKQYSLVTGICQEDSGGYPDCRNNFRLYMEEALSTGMGKKFKIEAPLMFRTKAMIVKLASKLADKYPMNDPWVALAFSHTSYDGAYPPMGKDHATLLRAKGFHEAYTLDPLVVRAIDENLMTIKDTEFPNDYELLHIQGHASYQARIVTYEYFREKAGITVE